jgi:hypothetical protein
VPPGPEARYEQSEAISLAFVTALQLLPPRQVAVLILRDVLGFHASEVAGMLEVSVGSANSALKRARASLQRRQQPAAGHPPPPAAGSPAEDAIVAKFARAWESADLDALVALLTDDVFIAMPPEPFGHESHDAVAGYCASLFAAGDRFDLVPTRANGQRSGPTCAARPASATRPLLRAHPRRRADLRPDPLRGQRAPLVRAAALTPGPAATVIRLSLARGWRPDLPRVVLLLLAGECGQLLRLWADHPVRDHLPAPDPRLRKRPICRVLS